MTADIDRPDLPPVRFSHLKHIAQSPAHYLANLDRKWDSPQMRLGRAVDAYVFAADPMPVVYEGERRGNAWKEFAAEHDGREILTVKEYDVARACADSILSNELAARVLDGDRWTELHWSYDGRACSSKPDLLNPNFITDLKTTANADPRRFKWHARNMGYHAQLAFYRMAAQSLSLSTAANLYLVVAEMVAPYAVTVYQLPEEITEEGARLCHEWMARLLECERTGYWPAYADTVQMLDWPVTDTVELTFGDELVEVA